jgi:phosphoesterase RecJ-like protein
VSGAPAIEAIGAVLAEPGRRFLVATHRNPDGDAIGSMLGMARALRAQGREATLWHAEPDSVPDELRFLVGAGEEITTGVPADARELVLLALDCASEHRLADHPPGRLAGLVVNVDHHHDNTRFGHLDLVDGAASSTAELVLRILDHMGWPLTPEVAEPLYVGLVTDTGRFSYANTGPDAHRAAARLIEAGVEPSAVYRRLYEDVPLSALHLAGRALAGAESALDGRLVTATLTQADMDRAGSGDTDGIVEALRAARGAEASALLRELPGGGGFRVSLRASSDRVDVSAVARSEGGGGGHRAAAGFTGHRSAEEILEGIRRAVAAQLGAGG